MTKGAVLDLREYGGIVGSHRRKHGGDASEGLGWDTQHGEWR